MKTFRRVLAAPFKVVHFTFSVAVLSVLLTLGIAGLVVLAAGALALVIFGLLGLAIWLALALILGVLTKGSLRVVQVLDPLYGAGAKDPVEELRTKVSNFNKLQAVH